MRLSRKTSLLTINLAFIIPLCIQCFTVNKPSSGQLPQSTKKLQQQMQTTDGVESLTINRRSIMIGTIAFLSGIQTSKSLINNGYKAYANEIPSVSVSEFEEILKESARSIEVVDFSGPKSEIVVVKLADGTLFTLSDIIESSSDPRSPLSISALCRGYKVPTKFSSLLGALENAPKRKKMYMNSREVEAAKKNEEKRERMIKDEEDRLEELRLMQE